MRFFRKPQRSEERGNNWILKNEILFDQSWQGKHADRVKVRYCSVFRSNLSGTAIESGGDFTGNGWTACNFFGVSYRKVRVDMDQYEECTLGNMRLAECSLWEVRAKGCSFAGTGWKETVIEDCTFQNCSFRNAQFSGCILRGNRFIRCVFEDAVFDGCTQEQNVCEDCGKAAPF